MFNSFIDFVKFLLHSYAIFYVSYICSVLTIRLPYSLLIAFFREYDWFNTSKNKFIAWLEKITGYRYDHENHKFKIIRYIERTVQIPLFVWCVLYQAPYININM
jgi:hypothetical protein